MDILLYFIAQLRQFFDFLRNSLAGPEKTLAAFRRASFSIRAAFELLITTYAYFVLQSHFFLCVRFGFLYARVYKSVRFPVLSISVPLSSVTGRFLRDG